MSNNGQPATLEESGRALGRCLGMVAEMYFVWEGPLPVLHEEARKFLDDGEVQRHSWAKDFEKFRAILLNGSAPITGGAKRMDVNRTNMLVVSGDIHRRPDIRSVSRKPNPSGSFTATHACGYCGVPINPKTNEYEVRQTSYGYRVHEACHFFWQSLSLDLKKLIAQAKDEQPAPADSPAAA